MNAVNNVVQREVRRTIYLAVMIPNTPAGVSEPEEAIPIGDSFKRYPEMGVF
jgi:hypothetical protein